MKAIVLREFGGAGNFAEAELPLPDVRPGDVRVRVRAVSFNPVDTQIRRGLAESRGNRSMILGRDLSGVVDAVHEGVADFKAGDEVYGYVCHLASSGTYAEYVSVPAELLARKPASLTHEQAAAVPVAGITALIALDKARADRASSTFIAGGAGGVGTFAIMLAKQRGVRSLVTTAGSAQSRAYLIERLGLHDEQILDYKDIGFIEKAQARNGGGFDAVLDLVGGKLLSAGCALLAVDGRLASTVDAPNPEDFEFLFRKNASFHAVGANAWSLLEDRAVWLKYREMLERLARLFDGGELAVPPVRGLGLMSADGVRQAHDLLEKGGVQGKLVMSCQAWP